ncbi:hypothetical protein GCM10007989_37200 [Devosia pacifica]|uniref:histidine kinase n=1 Tax=Devosia pacifica TaxID=1335967 RepID=A0A918SE04_9HYPH|nr:hybrid sensor histidine kinase/response regulator [Devosia pacifica]GHA37871.1 hypothetical protein GCM10007989_37200 [Devosia pacifica]
MHAEPAGEAERVHYRIVMLEDSDIDADLIESHLQSGPFGFELERVTTREDYEKALRDEPDLVLADYSLPGFDGLRALEIARALHPQLPFIFVSGVVGEEFATQALQQGASDYVTKRNLRRLHVAVSRAMYQAQERRQREAMESALRASEVGSRIALRAARLGGWDFDLLRNRLVWDARCHALFGVPQTTRVAYELFLSSLHPDDRERVDAAVRRATGGPEHPDFNEQFRVLLADDEIRWIESIGSGIYSGSKCVRLVGVVRDISDEKTAELALLDRTASLEASVEQQAMERHLLWRNSQDLLLVLGADGRLRDIAPSWQRILGHGPEQVIGKRFIDFTHDDDRDEMERALREAIPQLPIQFECRLTHQDGSSRWISWSATIDEMGVIYANGRDSTEEREAEERVKQMEDVLRQAQKMEAIGQLTGGIAHDFNNLLAGIVGAMDVLRRRIANQRYDDVERFLSAAQSSAHRAASLTQRLLAFSRRQSLDVQSVSANKSIMSMEDLLRRTLGENIKLELVMQPDGWFGYTDPNQLESAILNLAINARDAMPDGGVLRIETANVPAETANRDIEGAEPGDYILVRVSDTGEGMSEETISKAFDPFFTTKPIGQGTGLGLSMVYGFVRQIGGQVRIRSVLDKGTNIELYLRRAEEETPADSMIAAEDIERAREEEVVLVVEDDSAVRMLMLEILDQFGYHSIEASDAQSALPIVNSDRRIDLVISDVGLPGMNGRELAERIREKRPDMPVLFVTGYAHGAERRAEYLDSGMAMLSKPFRAEDVASVIRKLISS